MKLIVICIVAAVAVSVTIAAFRSAPAERVAVAKIASKSDSKVTGTATFTDFNGTVTLELKLSGMEPGVHAVHIHEKGDCSAHDATSTGGHWNPTDKPHGKWGVASGDFHLGDIGNVVADKRGRTYLKMSTDRWSVGNGTGIDIVGRGVIVHSGVDDYTTQPTGAAGGRVGCGKIELQ